VATNLRFLNPETIAKPPGYTHVVEVTGPWPVPRLAHIGRGKWSRGSARETTLDSGCDCGLPRVWRRPVPQAVGIIRE
jgi:hypothetical protein